MDRFKKYMDNGKFEFKTGGRMPYNEIYSAEKLLHEISKLENGKIYGLFKSKGIVGVSTEEFIPKKLIENKIKVLENEKKYYYSDWKMEELDSQIEVLKELSEEKIWI